jgi:hypothetical protein
MSPSSALVDGDAEYTRSLFCIGYESSWVIRPAGVSRQTTLLMDRAGTGVVVDVHALPAI